MEVREAYSKTYITREEEESVKRYLGFQHTAMNILTDFNPAVFMELKRERWYLPSEPEKVKKLIEDFANIYSAMYKNSSNYSGKDLIRGTSHTAVKNLGREFNQMISTTTDKNIAQRFMKYGDNALVHFRVGSGIPFLNAEDFREDSSDTEEEIILAPFCTIYHKEEIPSNKSEITQYRVDIGTPNLLSVPQEELDKMMEEVTQTFAEKIEKIKEYDYLGDKIEGLRKKYVNATMMDKIEIGKDIDESFKKIGEIGKETDAFREKLQTLLKGLCKQKEQEINLAKEVIEQDKVRRAEEEKKKREEEKIKRAEENKKAKISEIVSKMEQNPKHSQNLEAQITGSYQKLLEQERIFKEKAEFLGVPYTKTTDNTRIAERVEAIQDTIQHVQEALKDVSVTETDSQETVAQISKKVIPLMDGIHFGAIQTEAFPEIINLHVTQSEQEIKRNLYNKVQQTIQTVKIQNYLQERQEISAEKIGILGRLTGKQELQDERMNHINLKIQLARETRPEEKESYSVIDMLADLYGCAKTELGGNFTPEMHELYASIKQCYKQRGGKEFEDEKIQAMAEQKIRQSQNNLPMQIKNTNRFRFFDKTKSQTEWLRQQNMELKNQIFYESQKPDRNFCQVTDEQDAISMFDSRMNSIDKATRDKTQLDRKGPTIELW